MALPPNVRVINQSASVEEHTNPADRLQLCRRQPQQFKLVVAADRGTASPQEGPPSTGLVTTLARPESDFRLAHPFAADYARFRQKDEPQRGAIGFDRALASVSTRLLREAD